ncbi:MAG: hypothetical protein A2844_01070 [Candidatus Ryanbacteria bacterium RIFCSPHIGHO2_01_FULL_48_80]|nr:MAG: hypothetical protein A2844_01070 [Candidatus Ryanbacteria bacterium RIFCSPHIGHO2_01_FULL_48_80]
MPYALRTRFKKEIVTEFLPPRGRDTGKVIIFCSGMPSVPAKREFLEFYSKKGFWTFAPRYRGTWESGGKFLARSPHEDILDIIDELPRGFISFFDGKRYRVKPKRLYIFGSSFGGPAALLCSRDPRVTKKLLRHLASLSGAHNKRQKKRSRGLKNLLAMPLVRHIVFVRAIGKNKAAAIFTTPRHTQKR